MVSRWHDLRLRQRFMVVVGFGVVVLIALVVAVILRYEEAAVERKLHQLSVNEMTSLHALILNVMAKRPEDGDNIGISVFNNWFDSRNVDYPGKVWSVWGPKVAAHMKDTAPERAPKLAQDEVDREALATGRPVGRFVGGFYRYSMPIVLGVTDGARQEVCYSCHGAMGLGDGEVIAVLSSSLSGEVERAELGKIITLLVGGGALAAAGAVAGVWWIFGRVIVVPLGRMMGVMGRLAEGDTGVDIAFAGRRDEIGDIARAVEVFKEHMIDADRLREAQDQQREQAARERREALEAMADHFEATVHAKVEQVEKSTTAIHSTAQNMAQRSERSGGRSLDVGKAAGITTERSAMAADATRQLAHSVSEVAVQVGRSTEIARKAVADVGGTAERMVELAQAVQSIGDVVGLINDIAAQTNLLALNATIEAARAGEAGKGFAVVAGEVKNLANQPATATEEITRQVAAVRQSAGEMHASIAGVVETIGGMDEISRSIAEVVHEQTAAAENIAGNIDEVAVQAEVVSESVSQLSVASAQACAGTVRVIWSAKGLAAAVDDLRAEAEQFLVSIRRA
ncbi:MAG: methyl-accepting chemotaxis protein [Actinomycetota bacterium]